MPEINKVLCLPKMDAVPRITVSLLLFRGGVFTGSVMYFSNGCVKFTVAPIIVIDHHS
jgi:hypothetical protein